MTKTELTSRVDTNMAQTHDDLTELWTNINKGQQKQLAKKENIKAILDRYGVEYEQ